MSDATHSEAALPIYLLGGGRSRRFGEPDKLRALLRGEPLLAQVARVVGSRATRLTVVADVADKYADLGLRTIGDSGAHLGPLDGLRAALEDLGARGDASWLALVAGDLAHVRGRWVDGLLGGLPDALADAAAALVSPSAVAFRFEQRFEPLFALYSLAALETVTSRIAAGHRSMQRLLGALDTRVIDAPAGWGEVVNVNVPEELARADG